MRTPRLYPLQLYFHLSFFWFIKLRSQVRSRNFVTREMWAARKSTKRYVASAQELRKNLPFFFVRRGPFAPPTMSPNIFSLFLLMFSLKSLITQSMCWVDMPSALGVVFKLNLADLSRTNCSCFHCSYFSIVVVVVRSTPRDTLLLMFRKCVRVLKEFLLLSFSIVVIFIL